MRGFTFGDLQVEVHHARTYEVTISVDGLDDLILNLEYLAAEDVK